MPHFNPACYFRPASGLGVPPLGGIGFHPSAARLLRLAFLALLGLGLYAPLHGQTEPFRQPARPNQNGPARAETGWSRLSRLISPHSGDADRPNGSDKAAHRDLGAARPAGGGVPLIQSAPYEEIPTSSSMPAQTAPQNNIRLSRGSDEQASILGRESDEDETMLAVNMFKQENIRRLLGDAPRFVYDPANRPDPMLVPWVRRMAIYKELSEQAEQLIDRKQTDQAIALLKRIVALNDPRFSELAQGKIEEIMHKKAQAAEGVQPKIVKVELPVWVHDNTNGVIISPGNEVCLVGEFMLHAGQSVPNYPLVKVASIAPKRVVYQIGDKQFEVVLSGE